MVATSKSVKIIVLLCVRAEIWDVKIDFKTIIIMSANVNDATGYSRVGVILEMVKILL